MSWTVQLALSVEGVEKAHVLRLNRRRMLGLPWLVAMTATAALARDRRRAAWQALAASALVGLWATATVWLTTLWVFASVPGLVYSLAPASAAALRAVYEGLVGPPSARYVAGLACAMLVHVLGLVLRPARALAPLARTRAGRPSTGLASTPRRRA